MVKRPRIFPIPQGKENIIGRSALVSLSQLYQRSRLSSCPFFLFGLASSLNKFLRRYSQHILGMRVPRLGCDFLAL